MRESTGVMLIRCTCMPCWMIISFPLMSCKNDVSWTSGCLSMINWHWPILIKRGSPTLCSSYIYESGTILFSSSRFFSRKSIQGFKSWYTKIVTFNSSFSSQKTNNDMFMKPRCQTTICDPMPFLVRSSKLHSHPGNYFEMICNSLKW